MPLGSRLFIVVLSISPSPMNSKGRYHQPDKLLRSHREFGRVVLLPSHACSSLFKWCNTLRSFSYFTSFSCQPREAFVQVFECRIHFQRENRSRMGDNGSMPSTKTLRPVYMPACLPACSLKRLHRPLIPPVKSDRKRPRRTVLLRPHYDYAIPAGTNES